MSSRLRLVGFVTAVDGIDGQIYEAAPVFEDRPDRLLVARGLDWDVATSHEVTLGDEAFIHFIPSSEQVDLEPGWTVWIAGADFASGLQACANTRRQAVSMMIWRRLALRGMRWHAGPRAEFAEFVSGLEADLRAALFQALFDPEELKLGDASIVHELYSVLPLKERADRSIASGVYFFEIWDMARYEFTRAAAVSVYRAFRSAAEFDDAVASTRDALKRDRLRQTARPAVDAEQLNPTLVWSWFATLAAAGRRGESEDRTWLEGYPVDQIGWPLKGAGMGRNMSSEEGLLR